MTNDPDDLIGVREAARRLRVHENTIRNWGDRGVLAVHRLPGSGFRKHRAGDIEQLKQAVETGRLEQAFRSATAITTGELDRLLAVARMYLEVFADSNQMAPPQRLLYKDVAAIVARYAALAG